MGWTAKFLLSIRQSISQSPKPFNGKFGALRAWALIVERKIQMRASKFDYYLNLHRQHVQGFCLSGIRNTVSIFGISVVFGAVYYWPRFSSCARDIGLHMFVDAYYVQSFDALEEEDARQKLWMLIRKLWLPVLFVFTILVNWDNPFSVATRIVLFLLSTKPSPSSIYLSVERLCHGYMSQNPHLYRYKSLYASKVEVQDYKLLCLARVEIGDQKLHLIGILGEWWSLPSSLGYITLLRSSALVHH